MWYCENGTLVCGRQNIVHWRGSRSRNTEQKTIGPRAGEQPGNRLLFARKSWLRKSRFRKVIKFKPLSLPALVPWWLGLGFCVPAPYSTSNSPHFAIGVGESVPGKSCPTHTTVCVCVWWWWLEIYFHTTSFGEQPASLVVERNVVEPTNGMFPSFYFPSPFALETFLAKRNPTCQCILCRRKFRMPVTISTRPPQNTNQITNKGMEERKERSELSEDITFQASAKGSQNPQNGQPGGKRRKIHKSKAALKQKSNIATISKGLGEGHRRKAMR